MDIVIASDEERNNLFAEIRKDGQPWGEIILGEQSGIFELALYPPEENERMVVSLAEFEKALRDAKESLIERGYRETG
jgi:hypothetical protein